MKILHSRIAAALISVAFLSSDAAADDKGVQLFEQTILPTLKEHCYSCHSKSAETTEGGLELDSPSGLRSVDLGPVRNSEPGVSLVLNEFLMSGLLERYHVNTPPQICRRAEPLRSAAYVQIGRC